MAKPEKKNRPKASAPKGFRDYFGNEVAERGEMLSAIAEVYDRYGFEILESSAIETVEALGKFLPDLERPNEGVFAWHEDEENWLALRYDLTAPLARVYAQYRNNLPAPYRRYAMGPVWRNEKPGPGRYRQFYQCDADTVGSSSSAADAEICAMLSDILEAVGIARGDYVIRINSRKVLNGALESLGLSGDLKARDEILRTIDKFDKIGESGVEELLGSGRLDASGAFIEGVGLEPKQIGGMLALLASRGQSNKETLDNLKSAVGATEAGANGLRELDQISNLLDAQGCGLDRIIIDPGVVRGLGYYTGPVFEAELTFEILDEKGQRRQFGSVAGGGRYDDLVKRFTGQTVPATGISIGVDRLLAALREKGGLGGSKKGPVVVTVMDRDRMADYFKMAGELRSAGVRAEVYLGNPRNFGNQLKYADRRGSPLAVIEGTDEHARGVVQIKDLVYGAEIAKNASHEEWKKRPSQFEVGRNELAEKVKACLNSWSS
ncbi:MAG: histidine--tRNA ligase [Roseovarius sp.]|nr:histidine--tRNA ligase [Roseovarius sp.]